MDELEVYHKNNSNDNKDKLKKKVEEFNELSKSDKKDYIKQGKEITKVVKK